MKTIDDLEFDQRRYQRDLILYQIDSIERMTGRPIHEFKRLNKMYLDYCSNRLEGNAFLKVLLNEVEILTEGI